MNSLNGLYYNVVLSRYKCLLMYLSTTITLSVGTLGYEWAMHSFIIVDKYLLHILHQLLN